MALLVTGFKHLASQPINSDFSSGTKYTRISTLLNDSNPCDDDNGDKNNIKEIGHRRSQLRMFIIYIIDVLMYADSPYIYIYIYIQEGAKETYTHYT